METEPDSSVTISPFLGQAAFSPALFRDAAAAAFRDHVHRFKTPSLKGQERSGNVGHFLCVALKGAGFRLDSSANRVQIRGQGLVLVPAVGDGLTGVTEGKLFAGRCCVASFRYSKQWVANAVASGVPVFAYLFAKRGGVVYHEVGRIKSVSADGDITAWHEEQHAILEPVSLKDTADDGGNVPQADAAPVVDDGDVINDAPPVSVPLVRREDDVDGLDEAPAVAVPLKPRR